MLSPKMHDLYDSLLDFVEKENQNETSATLRVSIEREWIHVECKEGEPFLGMDRLSVILNAQDASWFVLTPIDNKIVVAAQVR